MNSVYRTHRLTIDFVLSPEVTMPGFLLTMLVDRGDFEIY